jgi:hypothetical protein
MNRIAYQFKWPFAVCGRSLTGESHGLRRRKAGRFLLGAFAMLVIIGSLSACSTLKKLTSPGLLVVAADPIGNQVISDAENAQAATAKNKLGIVLVDSETKCDEFTKKLSIANIGSNATLDIATTIFSAAATAVTPLGTVHGLTAASTVASGSKTAIDSDVFAKATIANIAQAISATYYKDMAGYEAGLAAEQPDSIVPSVEVAKILSIHKECALDSAEASISSTLGEAQPGASTPPVTSKLVTVSFPPPPGGGAGAAHAGDHVQLVATSAKDPNLKLVATYTVVNGDTPQAIARGLVASIQNSNSGFAQAGITASQNSPNDNFFTVQSPTASQIVLGPGSSPPTAETLTITDAKSTSQTGSSTGTRGYVPGHALAIQ